MERLLVIPAAGTGSRLGAAVPKLFVPVRGRPMLDHLLDLYGAISGGVVIVVSPGAEDATREAMRVRRMPADVVVQPSPTGMLDAIMLARPVAERWQPRRVLITWCDQVGISAQTVAAVAAAARAHPEPALVLPTCARDEPYVHLVRGADGRISGVRHRREGDAMPEFGESDAGVFDLSRDTYLRSLAAYAADPPIGARTGERNFVPFVAAVASQHVVVTVPCRDPEEAIGINTPAELARLEAYLEGRRS